MSIDPTNVAQTTASTVATTTTTTAAAASSLSSLGAEEEEESTLVEVSPSSSSSPTTVSSLSASSRTSTGTGDDGSESHPEEVANIAANEKSTTTTMTITSEDAAASADSSEASTVALVEDLTPEQIHRQQQQQQPTLAPVAAQVATDLPIEHQPRNTLPIQSSSSLSTPSSSEDYDESVTTSSTEGALNVSSSNNQLNNNNNSTAIGSSDQQATAKKLSSIESALPPLAASTATLVTSTPERTPSCKAEEEEQRQAPIEIVQIFPSTATTLSSSITSSSSSSSPSSGSSSSSGTSSASSTSSSPSVSPLAVDQQQPATAAATVSTSPPQVRAEAPPLKMDDSAICDAEIGDLINVVTLSDQQVPQKQRQLQDVDAAKHTLMYHNRTSSSSPQLQSSLKKYKMGERSSGIRRRVSFPKDAQLITGYLEPIDPWACVTIISVPELNELYQKSCAKHSTEPLPMITEHLNKLDLAVNQRVPLLSLKDQNLSHGSCEALEEIFKRVQYRSINLSNAGLDDTSASVLFDMIEYYEAANELDISDNLAMSNKSWLACINMVKKSQALNVLITRGPAISEHHAMNLAKALNTSKVHTLKLEHCELSQRPLATLCNLLKRNTILRELSLAHNQLTCDDAKNVANLLRSNYHIQLLDISNNSIGDKGVEYIVNALIDQSIYFKTMQETKRKSEFSFADLSSSLSNINSNKHYFPKSYGKPSQMRQSKVHQQQQHLQPKLSESSIAGAMSPTPLSMLLNETPKTPPPTPALPVRTPSGEALLMSTSLSPPVESQEEEPPPLLLPTAPAEATTALDESSDLQEKSTNNDSGINSSVSSEAEQTISDSSGNIVVSTEVQQQKAQPGSEEEEHLAGVVSLEHDTRVDGMLDSEMTSDISGDNLVDSGLVVCDSQDNNRTDSASDVEGSGEEGNATERDRGEIQTLELTFDLGDEVEVKGPKKARLAKQDSVLSEFESSMPELKLKTDIPKKKTTPSKAEEPMDEDTPEICADYDDPNLKIVEENLLVDRSINANSSESNDTKEEEDNNTTDNDDSAPVTPLTTHKKDELQLLLEKAKQQEEQDEETIHHPSMLKATLQRTEIVGAKNTIEDITSTIAPQSLGTIHLKIVEGQLKDKPLSRSLDSTGSSEFESPFLGGSQPPAFPNERSFSSESLNSETSVDSNDSKSSLKIIESKFAARNGTLERQQSNASRETPLTDQSQNTPCGLQVLVLWNNEITRNSAQTFSDLIENTSTLEILNAGCNLLCNDFVGSIKSSLKSNSSLTSLGLQGAHLSDNGAKVMAEVIEFGGNATLQRIDLRNNNILATGLDYLNEAMKSNKSVTRIDLDDVPRRVVENALEIGPEYVRLLNNIRAQCERNKHPQEPSEPISTSIKRLRSSHLSSRKISLTCTPSIRAKPSTATAGEKHHHHLLDPSKKTGGRLRSPLPSPIPSPIASPVPSPSRNRFQVTRVGESTGSTSSLTSINNTSNTSTSPSPSSTGSSPTLFFAANSRFRVVTVEEPASSSSVPNYPLGKMSSSSISPSPLVTGGISRMPPTSSSSAPALSSFVSSPKLTPSPIQQQSVATNTPLPPVLGQHQLPVPSPPPPPQQHHPQTQFPPPLPAAIPSVPPTTPKPKHARLPSTSSTLNDSVISSTSIESPDLEVKRFMSGAVGLYPSTGQTRTHSSTMDDSCCSSISSSIDSIDNVHFNNTSISSTDESFDLIVSSPSSSSISIGSVSTAPLVKSTSSQQGDCTTLIPQKQQQQQQHQQKQQQPPQLLTPTIKEPSSLVVNANLLKVKNNSLSSLEMSTSSQESLYDVQDLSSVSVSSSGGSSSLVGGVAARLTLPASSGNSNENTLTSIQSLDKDHKPAATVKSLDKPPRVRKTSWIASIGNQSKADGGSTASSCGNSSGSGYSPAIEKLLSIFNPSNLFSSNKSSPPSSECGTVATGGGSSAIAKENTSSSQPPSRKESPMGGLFPWSKSTKDEEKVLKVNISPENTIVPQQAHPLSQSQQSPQLPAFSVDNIPSQLKTEIKENISPENTITNKLLINPPPSSQVIAPVSAAVPAPAAAPTAVGSPHPKVIFRLGDDYDDSEDDIDTLTNKFGGGGGGSGGSSADLHRPLLSILGTSTGSTTTNSSGISISSNMAEGSPIPSGGGILQTGHLGQLARDSLTTMFKNASLTSQDSIRSMDSLVEMTDTMSQIPSQQQQQQHHQQRQQQHQHTPDDTQAQ
ncbi:serine-rich adhesin for platelets [Ochlerotatus camptorhynchus]|uniref:serine-rich adhesin for platelets n=1 Tax=Ochlerotatus camptorhynchus TaxID=644619 RepID=UPI0031CF0FA1